jgi:hypothetical protein
MWIFVRWAASSLSLHNSASLQSQFDLSRSTFTHLLNSAVFLHASQRILTSNETLLVEDSTFRECTAFRGGAISTTSSKLSLNRCLFENNSANYAGAVLASLVRSGKVASTTFHSNIAVNLGGSFFFDSAVSHFERYNFLNANVTFGQSGSVGGLECWGGLPTVSFGSIISCKSTFAHAAIRVSSVHQPATFTTMLFLNNSSRQKGAVLAVHIYQGLLRIEHSIFKGNHQNSTNGTAVWTDNSGCVVELIDCVVYGEKGRQFGGTKKVDWVKLTRVKFVYDAKEDSENDTPAPTRTPDCKSCGDWPARRYVPESPA